MYTSNVRNRLITGDQSLQLVRISVFTVIYECLQIHFSVCVNLFILQDKS